MATFRRTLINVPPPGIPPEPRDRDVPGIAMLPHCSPTLALRYGCNHRGTARGKSSRRGAARLVVNVMAKMVKRPRHHVEVIRHAYARLSNWFSRPASPYVYFAAFAGRLRRSCFACGFCANAETILQLSLRKVSLIAISFAYGEVVKLDLI